MADGRLYPHEVSTFITTMTFLGHDSSPITAVSEMVEQEDCPRIILSIPAPLDLWRWYRMEQYGLDGESVDWTIVIRRRPRCSTTAAFCGQLGQTKDHTPSTAF